MMDCIAGIRKRSRSLSLIATLATLAENEIAARLDAKKWKAAWKEVGKGRASIKAAAKNL